MEDALTDLIREMHRKALCRHDGYLPINSADAPALANEIASYCKHPDPTALAISLRAGHCQMFGIPIKVQD